MDKTRNSDVRSEQKKKRLLKLQTIIFVNCIPTSWRYVCGIRNTGLKKMINSLKQQFFRKALLDRRQNQFIS